MRIAQLLSHQMPQVQLQAQAQTAQQAQMVRQGRTAQQAIQQLPEVHQRPPTIRRIAKRRVHLRKRQVIREQYVRQQIARQTRHDALITTVIAPHVIVVRHVPILHVIVALTVNTPPSCGKVFFCEKAGESLHHLR